MPASCSYCDRPVRGRGLCKLHYSRWYNGMDIESEAFKQTEVHREHSDEQAKCSVSGCTRPYKRKGYCRVHYRRHFELGHALDSWEFLSLADLHSYAKVMGKYPTMRVGDKKVLCHVYVAEQALGRKLKGGEMVHHIDEDKANYRNDNLVIMYRWYHELYKVRLHPKLYQVIK